MPTAKVLEAKQAIVAELSDKLSNSVAGVVVDYSGTSVADDTVLRKELREANVKYSVVKNTLLNFAAKEVGLEGLDEVLNGTTAIATCEDDYTAAPRILGKYADGHDNFTIKSGFMDGKVVDLETIDRLAKLPTKEVLLATVLNAFQAPIAAFARAVQAIVDKDGAPAEEAAE